MNNVEAVDYINRAKQAMTNVMEFFLFEPINDNLMARMETALVGELITEIDIDFGVDVKYEDNDVCVVVSLDGIKVDKGILEIEGRYTNCPALFAELETLDAAIEFTDSESNIAFDRAMEIV